MGGVASGNSGTAGVAGKIGRVRHIPGMPRPSAPRGFALQSSVASPSTLGCACDAILAHSHRSSPHETTPLPVSTSVPSALR